MKGLDWFKVVSNIAFDDDMEHRSDGAFRTFLELIGISSFDLSDGKVSLERARKLCNSPDFESALVELFDEKYLKMGCTFLTLNNYKKYQQTRREVASKRAKNRKAVSDYRTITQPPVIEQSKSKSKSKNNSTPIVPKRFDEFWSLYPKKVGVGKAREAFTKALTKTDADTIINGLKGQLSFYRTKERQFIPLPTTWLNQERWSDELEAPPTSDIPKYRAEDFGEEFYQQ